MNNVHSMVGSDPLDYVDPLGLWQLTVTIGLPEGGYAAQFTVGNSASWYSADLFSGQWNGGAKIGVGQASKGVSGTFDPLAHDCKPSGTTIIEETLTADVGLGEAASLGLDQVANISLQDPTIVEFRIGGSISFEKPSLKPGAIGMDLHYALHVAGLSVALEQMCDYHN
jgi:hypothetical protein